MHIAVLLANNDTSGFSTRFPNDGKKVVAAIAHVRPAWESRVWSVKDEDLPSLEDADAFVITGSPASVHDPLVWIRRLSELVRELHHHSIPLVGLCFGHQLIATALGGEVSRSASGWRLGAVETHFLPLSWMRPALGTLRLFAAHGEQVTRLPAEATLIGSAPECPHAAYTVGKHIVTTQYHPEFSQEFMDALVHEYEGELADEVITQARHDLLRDTQGSVFFEWAAHFIEDRPAR